MADRSSFLLLLLLLLLLFLFSPTVWAGAPRCRSTTLRAPRYLNRAAPEWQYNAATDVHFNAGESQFYRQDPVTQQYRHVTYDATTGAYTDTEPPAPDPEPTGLGQAGLLPHVADHTFMQGRRPTQEDRHTMIPDYGKKLQGLGVQASFYAVFDGVSFGLDFGPLAQCPSHFPVLRRSVPLDAMSHAVFRAVLGLYVASGVNSTIPLAV